MSTVDTRLLKDARRPLVGSALAVVCIGAALGVLVHPAWMLPAATCGWLALGGVWPRLASRVRGISLALMTVGLAGIGWGAMHGAAPDWQAALTNGIPIVGLLVGVSFLQLVTMPSGTDTAGNRRDNGPGGFRNTFAGVHLFGAVINLSAVLIVADQLRRHEPLGRAETILLTRGFTTAELWSPFFAAMAVTLTFAPGANLMHLMAVGLPMALLAAGGTWMGTGRHVGEHFRGYPVDFQRLVIPSVLAILVIGTYVARPDLSVIAVITTLAPIAALAGVALGGTNPAQRATRHVCYNIPRVENELALFLSAGVMAAGLHSVILQLGEWTPFSAFGAIEAWLVIVGIVVLSLIGVHPVIGVAAVGTLLSPLHPDPTLLAVAFLIGWSVATVASPFSGLNLTMQGRYGVSMGQILLWHWRYNLAMVVTAAPLLWLVEHCLTT
nr:hypothetical protein [Halomonas socia]